MTRLRRGELRREGLRRGLVLVALIAAGEAVFFLPFVLARVFRPTLLDLFGITNLQLGTAFSLYGVVAMVAYFAGGPLADRYSARRLMALALASTGLGGFVLARFPAPATMNLLWAWWGLTTVLLFWAAMIRATREWGGRSMQGRAYGLLDGGRGLMAALVASVALAVFAVLMPGDAASATLAERTVAFRGVIWVFTGLTLGTGALVWLLVPDTDPRASDAGGAAARTPLPDTDSRTATPGPDPGASGISGAERRGLTLRGVRTVCRMPAVWLQGIIVICAYVGYKATDDFSLLARDALGFDEVAASGIGALTFWIRAAAAIAAGYLGDRLDASRVIVWGFGILIAGSLLIASGLPVLGPAWVLIATIVSTSIGIYALRGVYFALLAEGAVPLAWTGSAAGVVSVLGFTPDIFMGPLMGVLLDRSPGLPGHQHVFAAVAAFGAAGLLAALLFRRLRPPPPPA